jgi:hypothetical protein
MRGWLTVRQKSWCPLHRHSVNVNEELEATRPDAMDALLHARRVQLGTNTQLDLVCICGSSACEYADGVLLGCTDCGYEARERF